MVKSEAVRKISQALIVSGIIGTVSLVWNLSITSIDARTKDLVGRAIKSSERKHNRQINRLHDEMKDVNKKVDRLIFHLLPR